MRQVFGKRILSINDVLLGSVVGLAFTASAQASEHPSKAKPVEYVRVCSLYGEGFFALPGTDTCLRFDGYLRFDALYNAGNDGVAVGSGPLGTFGRLTRDLSDDLNHRVRTKLYWDIRQQTEYGTLRSYFRVGWSQQTPGATGGGTAPPPYWDRAFIQFAGFTVGRAQSFFDIYTYAGGTQTYLNARTSGDTGPQGQNLWAYTAQFGNGLSGSVSLEDPATRRLASVDTTCAGFFQINGPPTQDNGLGINGTPCAGGSTAFGWRVPDIIGNLRVDQAWGYAGVSVALHNVSGAYWMTPNNVNNGHPADKYGWAVAVGGQFNVGSMGDTLGIQATYAEGAAGFVTNATWWQLYKNSTQIGVGWLVEAVSGGRGSEIELTRTWNINAAYEHFWSAKWRTTWYGGYVHVDYDQAATNFICANRVAGFTLFAAAQPAGFNCNPDFSFYQVGSRTQWNPVPQLGIGLDVFYTKLNTAFKGPANLVANGSRPACLNNAVQSCSVDDQGVWSAIFRWQRNFYQ